MTELLRVLNRVLELGLLHGLISVVSGALVLSLIVQFLLALVLQGRENQVTRFFKNVTAPVLAPLERIIPPISIGGISFSIAFIAAWWAIQVVADVLSQALPTSW